MRMLRNTGLDTSVTALAWKKHDSNKDGGLSLFVITIVHISPKGRAQ